MRAFLSAVVVSVAIAALAAFALDGLVQRPSDIANTTGGARVDFAKDGVSRTR